MAYSLAKVVDQVYLAVTGGIPTDDINLERDDIRSLAPSALNEALIKHLNLQLTEAVQEWREYGVGREGIGQHLYNNYTLSVQTDSTRGLNYVLLPAKEMYLPGDRGFREAFIPGGEEGVSFKRVGSSAEIRHIPALTGVIWMWYETGVDSRVYFKGLGFPKPDSIVIRAALDLSSYDYEADLPLPESAVLDAIILLTEYFRGERMMPEDENTDSHDNKQ